MYSSYFLIHEVGHILAIILTGHEFLGLEPVPEFFSIGVKGGGKWDDASRRILYASGSIFVASVGVLFMIYSYKREKITLFFTLYTYLGGEGLYWLLSPFLGYGDAFLLLSTVENDALVRAVILISSLMFMIIMHVGGALLFLKLVDQKWKESY